MTEIDWHITSSPAAMLGYLRVGNRTSSRKMQLLMCGACRMVLDHLPPECAGILHAVELYAEGLTALDTFRNASTAAQLLERETPDDSSPRRAAVLALRAAVSNPLDDGLKRIIEWVPSVASRDAGTGLGAAARSLRERQLCELFREIIGNPFLARKIAPVWAQGAEHLTIRVSDAARSVAEGIHRDQAFDRFPILADALEEEGCTDEELLLHMRQPHSHVRGCWALDLVLGKK